MAYRHEGFFLRAWTPTANTSTLNELWDSGEAPWKVWE